MKKTVKQAETNYKRALTRHHGVTLDACATTMLEKRKICNGTTLFAGKCLECGRINPPMIHYMPDDARR